MEGSTIFAGIFIGIMVGLGFEFLRNRSKNKLIVRNATRNIKKQNLSFVLDGKPYNFIGEIDKEIKKRKDKAEEQEKKIKFPFIKKPIKKGVNKK